MIVEKWLAAVTLAVCAVLALRMVLGPRRQQRFDAALRRTADAVRRPAVRGWHRLQSRRRAARAADEAVRRARKLH